MVIFIVLCKSRVYINVVQIKFHKYPYIDVRSDCVVLPPNFKTMCVDSLVIVLC